MRTFAWALLIVTMSIAIGLGSAYLQVSKKNLQTHALFNPLISVEIADKDLETQTTESNTNIEKNKMKFAGYIEDYINTHKEIDFSISVVELKTNKKYEYNNETKNKGASTTKLFTASKFLSEIEENKEFFNTPLGSYNAKFQFEQLVNQSNNDSWELFNSLLGINNIEDYAHRIGSNSYQAKDNSLKASDMTNYLVKLYEQKLHSKENTEYLLSLMQVTNEERFIPNIKDEYKIFHKNGQLEDVVNEAIIAAGDKNTYAIAIYTNGKGTWDYDNRQKVIKEIMSLILTE